MPTAKQWAKTRETSFALPSLPKFSDPCADLKKANDYLASSASARSELERKNEQLRRNFRRYQKKMVTLFNSFGEDPESAITGDSALDRTNKDGDNLRFLILKACRVRVEQKKQEEA